MVVVKSNGLWKMNSINCSRWDNAGVHKGVQSIASQMYNWELLNLLKSKLVIKILWYSVYHHENPMYHTYTFI